MVDPAHARDAARLGSAPFDLAATERHVVAEVRWGPVSERVTALIHPYVQRELPVHMVERMAHLAAVAWNLSRRRGEARSRELARLVIDRAERPLLLEFVEIAEEMWPDDPRLIGSIELRWFSGALDVDCEPAFA